MKRFVILFSLLVLLSPGSVRAEDSTETSRSEIHVNVKTKESTGSAEKERRLSELRKVNELRKAELEKMKKEKREVLASLSGEIKKRREEFATKIAKIRDERKKKLLENINEKLKRVNLQRTEHWKKVLSLLQDHLNKIKSRREEVKTGGKDTAEVDGLITTAQTNIDAALLAVNTQAAKEYVMTITTEGQLKVSASTAISSEQTDLRTVQHSIDLAKKSVKDSLVALAKLKGESLLNVATKSGQTSL